MVGYWWYHTGSSFTVFLGCLTTKLIGNFENFAICIINYGIECPIGPLSYISEALMQVTEQSLFTHNFIVFDNQANYMRTSQSSYKQIALPFRN